MFTVDLEKKCGCAKKDQNLNLPQSFESEAEAEITALRLANHMNSNYCKKHRFSVKKEENQFIIQVELSCKDA
jgi:hypothetical protein